MTTPRRHHVLAAVAALGGVALFIYSVRSAGADRIASGVARVGWGLIPILALGGLRFVLRAEAWRLCTPVGSRLTLRQAFKAFLAGDALGNVTPLGLVASEPTKVFLTRHQLATRESVASLAGRSEREPFRATDSPPCASAGAATRAASVAANSGLRAFIVVSPAGM